MADDRSDEIDPVTHRSTAERPNDLSAPKPPQKWPVRRILAMGAAAAAMAGIALVGGSGKADSLVARAMGWIDAVIPSSGLAGLSFANVRTTIAKENGEMALMIEGEIRSDSESAKSLPQIQFTMRDGTESTIFQWMIPAPAASIVKGEPIPFKARLASPPRDGKDIMIRFSGA
jgi:hypothetical protein